MRDQFDEGGIVLENALAFWANRFSEVTRRGMYRAFAAHGVELTPEQWMVLVRLWERDGRTQSDLAAATHRDAPTLSRILDSMAKAGLVARAVDPNDARARLAVLTPRGRALKATLVPVVRDLVAGFEEDIPERDLEITRRTLRRIVERNG
ncbi:Transcriptional regulator, MarR family protein [Minicystis rosea]|nr:Transcriptional regulator, MarR family protein [Minicystis rosea]